MSQRQGICSHPITIHDDIEQLAQTCARRVIALAGAAISSRGSFHLALSGGSTPRRLYAELNTHQSEIDWRHVHLYFGDERAVPPDHKDSNYRMASESLIAHIPIPAGNVHRMDADPTRIEADAEAYARVLRDNLGANERDFPVFDLILLGLGPDGHTCSLFPGTPILEESERSVGAVHVERLASWRLSLTYPVLNSARHLLFLVAGTDKVAIMQRICGQPTTATEPLPVQRLEPGGQVEWHLDRAAANGLAL